MLIYALASAAYPWYNVKKLRRFAMSQEDIKREISAEDQYNYSDELFYTGPGDLLDTAEGRAKFCRINETTVFRKKDPGTWNNYIWVFNNQGVGMTIKKQSRVDPQLMECIDYDADGNEIGKAYEPTWSPHPSK